MGCTVDSCDEGTDEIVHLPDDDACGFGIELLFDGPQAMRWTDATGFERWNYYRGDLSVLIGEGTYTQSPGANALAARFCDLDATTSIDDAIPTSGQVAFVLVSGTSGDVESGLGEDANGAFRANTDPCP